MSALEGYKKFVLPLHLCVWCHDTASLTQLLEDGLDVNAQDNAKHTPIMLALKLKQLDSVRILLKFKAQCNIKDAEHWNVMSVARSVLKFPDPDNEAFLRELLTVRHVQVLESYRSRIPSLSGVLAEVPNFAMEIDIAFSSWIPLIGRVLPTETLKIWKLGQRLRIDLTLVGFEGLKWQRGQLSFIFDSANAEEPGKLTLVDHEHKTIDDALKLFKSSSGPGFDDALERLLIHKVVTQNLWSRDAEFAPATSGVWNKTETVEKVCTWNTRVMNMSNLKMTVLTRPRPLADRKPLQEFLAKQVKAVTDFGSAGEEKEKAARSPSPASPTREPDEKGEAKTDEDLQSRVQAINMVVAAAEYSMGTQGTNETVPQADYTEAIISAGKQLVLNYPLKAFDKFSWAFAVLYYDVMFHVEFVDANSSAKFTVHEPTKIATTNKPCFGSYVAPTEGTAVVRFDNTYSRFRAKTLKYRFASVTPTMDGSLAKPSSVVTNPNGTLVSFKDYFGLPLTEVPPECKVKGTILMPPIPCTGDTKTTQKTFSSKIWLAQDFPLSKAHICAVAEVLARTTTHFENFKTFMESRMPPGVPVRFEIPLLPMIAASITFSKCVLCNPDEALFEIPPYPRKQDGDTGAHSETKTPTKSRLLSTSSSSESESDAGARSAGDARSSPSAALSAITANGIAAHTSGKLTEESPHDSAATHAEQPENQEPPVNISIKLNASEASTEQEAQVPTVQPTVAHTGTRNSQPTIQAPETQAFAECLPPHAVRASAGPPATVAAHSADQPQEANAEPKISHPDTQTQTAQSESKTQSVGENPEVSQTESEASSRADSRQSPEQEAAEAAATNSAVTMHT